MFQPQSITCTHCQYQNLIITEDIHVGNLVMASSIITRRPVIIAKVVCPNCYKSIELEFKWKQTVKDEMLFECVNQHNTVLQMWRWMVNDKPLTPQYRPGYNKRTALEQSLDKDCKRIADDIVEWHDKGTQSNSLETILSQVQDYTKGNSWKNFNKKHKVVAVCCNSSTSTTKQGYSGNFAPVHHKNPDLMAAIRGVLQAEPEEKSVLFCNNKVGHCAEVHASNTLLFYEPQYSLHDLKFSIAYLIRNALPRSYCMNCITLFQLNNA